MVKKKIKENEKSFAILIFLMHDKMWSIDNINVLFVHQNEANVNIVQFQQ